MWYSTLPFLADELKMIDLVIWSFALAMFPFVVWIVKSAAISTAEVILRVRKSRHTSDLRRRLPEARGARRGQPTERGLVSKETPRRTRELLLLENYLAPFPRR
jgi:hypothetical protein